MANTFAQKSKMQELLDEGATVKQIADYYEVSEEDVVQYIESRSMSRRYCTQRFRNKLNNASELYLSSISDATRCILHGAWS